LFYLHSYQIPKTAGRSSQLFNTGTVSWYYRTTIEKLFGLVGSKDGLKINPQLPSHWQQVKVIRQFRGSTFNTSVQGSDKINSKIIAVNGKRLDGDVILLSEESNTYTVNVTIPSK
jgi:cellobionic acid phosphorylase